MGSFDGIIRVRKFELDEQRRALRLVEDELAGIDEAIQKIADDMAVATEGVDAAVAAVSLGAFLAGARARQARLLAERENKHEEVEKHRLLVSGAYQDLKTIEIAAEKEAEREARELDRKLQNEADEQGMRTVLRGGREGDPSKGVKGPF